MTDESAISKTSILSRYKLSSAT